MRQHSGDLSGSNTSSLLLDSGLGGFNSNSNTSFMSSNNQPNNMSPFATPFFPPGDTVESVIGEWLCLYTLYSSALTVSS